MPRERPILDMWLVNIPDDRGQIRKIRMSHGHRATREPLSTEERKRWKRMARETPMGGNVLMGAIGGMFVVLWMWLITPLLPPGPLAKYSFLVMIPPLWLAIDFAVLGRSVRPHYRDSRVALAKELRRCPWCLYPLNPTSTDPDALTICPECGGAWKLPSL